MTRRLGTLCAATLAALAATLGALPAQAQQPQDQAPPPQGYPPLAPQGMAPQQGHPPPQYPPPQGYPPAQGYPPQQGYPPPQSYPPPQGYPPQPYPPQQPGYPPPQPGYAPMPVAPPPAPPPVRDPLRGNGEMGFMYGAGVGYGVGTGIWIDILAQSKDPGIAILAPLAFGVAVPAGFAVWDYYGKIHRAVPASVGTGLILGAMEGLAISGTQWQLTSPDKQWGVQTYASLTWVTTTVGGVGGYFFGEFAQPDPRSMGFIASGAGWGAIAGSFFGGGVTGTCDRSNPNCIWDGVSVGGLIMTNVGIAATGIASVAGYVPSNETLKWQWVGFGAGMLVTTPIYIVYAFSEADPKHGLVANAAGAVAGLALATILTYNKKDDVAQAKAWTPPFQLTLSPTNGGATMGAIGVW